MKITLLPEKQDKLPCFSHGRTPKILYVPLILFFVLTSLSTGWGVTVEEAPLEVQLREVAKTLRCAVCQSESIWESNAGLAKQMREVIRERLEKGQSPDEIRAYFVSRYGDYILLKPQKRGMNWILWVGPFVLLLVGGISLYRTLSRWVTRTASEESQELPPISEQERKRIEQELHSLEE
jgi:cytochrome c-type biogenesis protein CcmH